METAAVSAPRVFMYVQHLLGIGHLVRASRVADALAAAGFDVAVATGGYPVGGFPGQNVRSIALPPVRAGTAGFSELEDRQGTPVDDEFKAKRVELLLAAMADERPDVVVIEAFPFGRRMMRFELLPMLDLIRGMRNPPLVACSVRDILQENAKPGRTEETTATIARYFDLVLVHGDPTFSRFEETFPSAGAFRDKIFYTGFVAGPAPRPALQVYDIIVSAGGGAAGGGLVQAAMEALRPLAASKRCCLIVGPNYPGATIDALKAGAPANLDIFAFRADLPDLLGGAELSISQAGYNTVCDILRAGCRSLLIPFAKGGETEQTRRAMKLKALGLADVLSEQAAEPERLSALAASLLRQPIPAPHGLNLDGAAQTARLIKERLARRGR